MDPQKVDAILDWPAPTDKKVKQCFVGFTNFYRKFIREILSHHLPHHTTNQAQ